MLIQETDKETVLKNENLWKQRGLEKIWMCFCESKQGEEESRN